MAKLKGQLFARLALDYFDHPKVAGLSSDAIVAHLEMLVYSRKYLTDGVIPMRVAMRYAMPVVDELASNDPENPSVTRCDDGSLILYGYGDFQETKADVDGRRRSARERAEARWSKDAKSTAPRNARSNAASNAETETETETYISASQASAKVPDLFPDWWAIWGKKKAKGDAAKAYKAALKIIPHDDLMAKTRTYWEHVKATGLELTYVPYPASWLRAEQWDDDLTADTPQQQQAVFDPRQGW
ncbi:hypothetical protein [Brachybacterium sp. FME24]|uniref:hypothetical protein n=1 Tax=Brachybacterium sp. FME24 TaxID=2742605 RepID=UPI001867C0E2|nr:hypothetical protein [Brachybacterium sp. FME24]